MSHNKVAPITEQPQAGKHPFEDDGAVRDVDRMDWANSPAGGMNVMFPDTACLTPVDQLLVGKCKSIIEKYDDVAGVQGYCIMNMYGQQLYQAVEESHEKCNTFNKMGRGFTLHIYNKERKEVMRAVRDTRHSECTLLPCCCVGCAQYVRLETADEVVIGYIRQRCLGGYKVQDAKKNTILQIDYVTCEWCACGCACGCACTCCECECCQGCCMFCVCCCVCCCCELVEVPIYNRGNVKIGQYSNRWTPPADPNFSCELIYGFDFPQNLRSDGKALLLAGGILMNVLKFEPATRCCCPNCNC